MKNLYLYLMAMTALMSIIVTVNVLAMNQVKQNEMMERMQDFLSEMDNFLSNDSFGIVIRELADTIFNLLQLPIIFLAIGAGLAWNWWFSSSSTNGIKNSPLLSPTTTNSPSSLSHGYNLRTQVKKNFILNEK